MKEEILYPCQVQFRVKANLQIVSSQTAHILADYRADIPGLDFREHCGKPWTVKRHSGIPVIRKMPDMLEALGLRKLLQIGLLIQDTIALALKFIVAGKPLIQCCNFRCCRHGVDAPFGRFFRQAASFLRVCLGTLYPFGSVTI